MLRHVTKKLKCVLLPTQSKSDKATRQAKSLRTNRIIHPTFHLFMRLPKELRLMIYDNIIGTTRRQLPLTNARIYYDYLHSAILQTCKQVAEEAGPILHRRRIEILGPPVLTIRINPNRYDSALYFIKHLLKLIGECRAAEIEETGASANVILPWLFSGDKDRNIRIGTLFSVELSQSSPITNGRKFQDFFQRTMRHMRRQSTVVVRLLVDGLFRTHPFNIMEFWSETAVDLEQYSRMINFRFVFVVPKQQLESYKGLAVRPRSVPPWITEDMWSVEAAKRGGVDPAVD